MSLTHPDANQKEYENVYPLYIHGVTFAIYNQSMMHFEEFLRVIGPEVKDAEEGTSNPTVHPWDTSTFAAAY